MGLADRLGLTRSSQFIATVEIHELLQVPLVQGKFRIKWKFKGSTNNHFGSDLIDGDESLLSSNIITSNNLTNRKGPLSSLASRPRGVSADSSNKDSTAEESSGGTGSSRRISAEFDHNHQRSLSTSRSSIPSSPYTDSRTPNPNRTPTTTTNGFNFNSTNNSNPTTPHAISRNGSPDIKDRLRMYSDSEQGGAPLNHLLSISRASELPDLPPASPIVNTPRIAEAKGSTNLVPLRSHTATFNREINCVVSIPLRSLPSSSSYVLQSSPMRLSIRQEVIGMHGQKEEIRTGEVILDLSQFVGNGTGDVPAPRRYLLRDSKTNATLRATVRMEWIGGESKFVAPPLRSGQVKEATTTTTVISTPTSNRSSTSLSSRKVSSLSTRDGGITMTSSSSVKSASTVSLHSTGSVPVRSSSPARSRGWHPSSSAYSAPTGIGEAGAVERNAHDIIDTLFNRPRNNHTKSHDALKGQINHSSSDAQVESIAGTKKPTSLHSNSNSSPAKGKERESWFKIPTNSSPSKQLPHLSPTSTTVISLAPLKIDSRRHSSHSVHTLPPKPLAHPPDIIVPTRKFSSASVSSSVSRTVRWGDDNGNGNGAVNGYAGRRRGSTMDSKESNGREREDEESDEEKSRS